MAARWRASSRIATRPPCTFGCSVFTLPSIISGKPVSSETSRTARPASASALRVPPVETSSTFRAASARAKSTSPDLSETESRARATGRRRSVMGTAKLAWRPGGSTNPRGFKPASGGINNRDSQRQFRLFGGSAGRRRGHVAALDEGPAHTLHLSGATIDHELRGAAGSLAPRQIHTLLEIDGILVAAEGPHLAVGKQKQRAVAVGETVRFDGRMQMEAHRESIRASARQPFAVRRQKPILAVEAAAVRRYTERALVHDAEAAGIAVVGSTELQRVLPVLTRHRHLGRTLDDGRAQKALQRAGTEKLAGGYVVERHRRMRGGRAGNRPASLAARGRQGGIRRDAVLTGGKLEGEAAGVRLLAHVDGWSATGIGDHQQRACLHALISAVRRVGERRSACVIVGEHGCQ